MTDEAATGRKIPLSWAVFILTILFVLACVPIWVVEYPPLVDYPMHVARAYLLSLPQDGQGITEFYQASWQPLPNLGMDILVSQMMRLMPPLIAGKVFLCLIQLGLLTGGFAFSVALLRRVTIAAFLPALALFDQWFWMGFANYLFGLGIALWAVAVWLWSENWPRPRRWWTMSLFAVALVVCHLMAFLVAAGVIFVLSLPKGRNWTKLVAATSVGLCALAFAGLAMTGRTPVSWEGRLQTLGNAFGPNSFGIVGLVCVLGLFWTWRPERAVTILAGLAVFVCLGPSFLGGTAFACDRLTLPFLVVGLATSVPVPKHERSLVLFLLAAMVVSGMKAKDWLANAAFSESVVSRLRALPRRSTLATFVLGQHERPTWKYQRHVADWILVEQPVFVASNFAKKRQQPMVFRPAFEEWHEYQDNNPIELGSWEDYESQVPKLVAMQARLHQRTTGPGPRPGGLFALVLHEKGDSPDLGGPEVVGQGPEFILLRVE